MAAWNFVTTHGGANPDGYDAEDRFVHFAQSAQSKTFNFTRSDIGNINNINLNGTGTARTFNNIHALTQIGSDNQTFDVDGNLTLSHAGHTLAWDEAGMMKESVVPNGSPFGIEGTTEYGYDADRKRVWKKHTPPPGGPKAETSVYVYAGPNCIAEYPAGTAAASPTQEYVYAQEIDSLVLLVKGGGTDKYTITRNQQWSVTALAELATGTIVERYTYDHFGKRTILEPNGTTVRSTSSYAMPYGYTSRRHDAETDLMYFRARYYDTHTAEFLSPDLYGFKNDFDLYHDGQSLYRAYYVLESQDPSGEIKVVNQRVYNPDEDVCNGDRASGIAWDWELDAERQEGWIIQRVEFFCKKCECDHCGECSLNCEEKGPYVYFEVWRVDAGKKNKTLVPKINGDYHSFLGSSGSCLTSIRKLEARFISGGENKVSKNGGWNFTNNYDYGHDYCTLTSCILPHYDGNKGEPILWQASRQIIHNEKPVSTGLELNANCCLPDGNGGYSGDGYYNHKVETRRRR